MPVPRTVPVLPTVATAPLLLVQVPVPSVSAAVVPWQMLVGVPGLIATGSAFIVTLAVVIQVPML